MVASWRYERIEGARHWLPLEQPERVAALAIEWFSEIRGHAPNYGLRISS
jgi:hypothetical protein